MFLEMTLKRNPVLVKTAFEMHREGLLQPDTYILDLDAIVQNARNILEEANKYGITLYFMTKQFGRNPYISKELIKLGYKGAVAVDYREAELLWRNGIPVCHAGHLVQVPTHQIKNLIDRNVDMITVYSVEKAKQISETAVLARKCQDIMLKVTADGDVIYPGQVGGIDINYLQKAYEDILTLPNVMVSGLTSFPCFIFDQKKGGLVETQNVNTILAARKLLEEKCSANIKQINTPSATWRISVVHMESPDMGFWVRLLCMRFLNRLRFRRFYTCRHIIEKMEGIKLRNLEQLGLMNALGEEIGSMKKSSTATYGIAGLAHYGADTFYGHQEIMGTRPKKPIAKPFQRYINKVYGALVDNGYDVLYMGDRLKFLLVNDRVTVADNIEADPGQAYNVTTTLDLTEKNDLVRIGRIVRSVVDVPRVIAFGGKNVKVGDLLDAVEIKEDQYIGINAPKCGVYREGYFVQHLGYGVDPDVQIPSIFHKAGIRTTLIGKAADILENSHGKNIPCVDTIEVMRNVLDEMQSNDAGLIVANVQETDLAGHTQDVYKYAEKLEAVDYYIAEIMEKMDGNDFLVIMADHGNDPTIGHNHHTREKVPLLVYSRKIKPVFLGYRETLSDVAATVAEFFGTSAPENGKSFLEILKG